VTTEEGAELILNLCYETKAWSNEFTEQEFMGRVEVIIQAQRAAAVAEATSIKDKEIAQLKKDCDAYYNEIIGA
jgi:hypothetical protein